MDALKEEISDKFSKLQRKLDNFKKDMEGYGLTLQYNFGEYKLDDNEKDKAKDLCFQVIFDADCLFVKASETHCRCMKKIKERKQNE